MFLTQIILYAFLNRRFYYAKELKVPGGSPKLNNASTLSEFSFDHSSKIHN